MCVCMCICVYVHMGTNIYTYMHKYTNTFKQTHCMYMYAWYANALNHSIRSETNIK